MTIFIPLGEFILASWLHYYQATWMPILALTALATTYSLFFLFTDYNRHVLNAFALVNSALGTIFLIYRCAVQDFNPILTFQIFIVISYLTLVFGEIKYFKYFVFVFVLSFISTIPFLRLSDTNHATYALGGLLATLFFAFHQFSKANRVKALKFSEIILETYDKLVVISNIHGQTVYVNPHCIELLECEGQKFTETQWWEMLGFNPMHFTALRTSITEIILGKRSPKSFERYLVLPDGTRRVIQWNIQVIKNQYLIAVGTDITELKIVSKESRRLNRAVETMNAGVIISDSKGNITWCNETISKIFGYSMDEIVGRRPSEVFEVPDFFRSEYEKILSEGIRHNKGIEIPYYRKDGSLIWILLSVSALASGKEDKIEYIEVVTDISAQKKREQDFKEISWVVKRSMTPMIMCDKNAEIEWYNDAFKQKFNFFAIKGITHSFQESLIGPWTSKTDWTRFQSALEDGRPLEVDLELKVSGAPRWYHLSLYPVESEYNQTVRNTIILQDIQAAKDSTALIKERNQEILDSISYAKRIQSAILPNDSFVEELLPDGFFYHKPKDIVSGDFYTLKELGDKLYIAVADCTGHGIPGAMISFIGSAAINHAFAEITDPDPSEILEFSDRYLKEALSAKSDQFTDGMDLGILVIDRKEDLIHYAGARRPLIMIDQNTLEVNQIPGTRRSIGEFVEQQPRFENTTVKIEKDWSIYLFTDGLTDQFGGPTNKKLKLNRFIKYAQSLQSNSMIEQRQSIEEMLHEWTDNFSINQTDDILVFGVHLRPVSFETEMQFSTIQNNLSNESKNSFA